MIDRPVSPPVGILLVNLGSPDAAEPAAVRRYLREFLSDPRVIEDQGLLWKFVLNAIILTTRPRRRARDYAKIWNKADNEAPLKTITRAQAQKLAIEVKTSGAHVLVDWAMRYGKPGIGERIEALTAQGCDRLLAVPLYPQYAAATTATVGDEVFSVLSRLRRVGAAIVPPYQRPVYIDAVASMRASLAGLAFGPTWFLPPFTAFPKAMPNWAIPIRSSVPRPSGYCARSSVTTRTN
jgi:ferrochelatase